MYSFLVLANQYRCSSSFFTMRGSLWLFPLKSGLQFVMTETMSTIINRRTGKSSSFCHRTVENVLSVSDFSAAVLRLVLAVSSGSTVFSFGASITMTSSSFSTSTTMAVASRSTTVTLAFLFWRSLWSCESGVGVAANRCGCRCGGGSAQRRDRLFCAVDGTNK